MGVDGWWSAEQTWSGAGPERMHATNGIDTMKYQQGSSTISMATLTLSTLIKQRYMKMSATEHNSPGVLSVEA